MSFSCPHFDPVKNFCQRCLSTCVPGRPGCVLAKNSTFAVPASERGATSTTRLPAVDRAARDAVR